MHNIKTSLELRYDAAVADCKNGATIANAFTKHGLAIVLAKEHEILQDLLKRISQVGLANPESKDSQYLMYDLNAYLVRNHRA